MIKALQSLPIPLLLLIATVMEVTGDAVVRMAVFNHAGTIRIVWLLGGGTLLLGYGFFLNTAPVEFGRIVGLYIATLFIVWQVINFAIYRTVPAGPIWLGGIFVIVGGLVITFWR